MFHKPLKIITSYRLVFAYLVSFYLALSLSGCGTDNSDSAFHSIKNEQKYQDEALLAVAWRLPVASTYKKNFTYQENGAFCGPASVVNTLNSLGVLGLSQSNVIENSSIYYIKARILGLTLDEMRTIFEDNLKITGYSAWSVTEHRDLTIAEFRDHMRQANRPDFRYVINFSRLPLFGVDIGHHSPIGGYIEDSDSVFLLDVLEDYKPFIVSSDKLFIAMNTIDSETEKKRGLIQLHRFDSEPLQNPADKVK
jgi:hypothetical protein